MNQDKEQKTAEMIVFNNVFLSRPINIYLFKKTNKLCLATYAITESIKDIEPIKWSLRQAALDLVKVFSDIKNYEPKTLTSALLVLRNTFGIAQFSKQVSLMNSDVMEREINFVIEEIEKELGSKSGFNGTMQPGFFDVDKFEYKREDPAQDLISQRRPEKASNNAMSYKGQNSVLYTKMSFIKNPDGGIKVKEEFKGQRREEILKIIKMKKDLTIKDISNIIKDCSEKTIQRELISMLQDGLIKKSGERRWSRYSPITG